MTKDHTFNLSSEQIKDLKQFVNEPLLHIQSFVKTFEESVKQSGSDSFTPMVTIFRDLETIEITIVSKSNLNKEQMYQSFAEMLHYFSASKSYSFIFAVDVRQTIYSNKNFKSKTNEPVEALTLSFVSEDSSGILVMPYTIKEKEVNWIYEDFDLSKIADQDPSEVYQGDMAELLYTMTHLEDPLFTPAQLLNYYNYKNYMFIIPDESKIVNSIKVELQYET